MTKYMMLGSLVTTWPLPGVTSGSHQCAKYMVKAMIAAKATP